MNATVITPPFLFCISYLAVSKHYASYCLFTTIFFYIHVFIPTCLDCSLVSFLGLVQGLFLICQLSVNSGACCSIEHDTLVKTAGLGGQAQGHAMAKPLSRNPVNPDHVPSAGRRLPRGWCWAAQPASALKYGSPQSNWVRTKNSHPSSYSWEKNQVQKSKLILSHAWVKHGFRLKLDWQQMAFKNRALQEPAYKVHKATPL